MAILKLNAFVHRPFTRAGNHRLWVWSTVNIECDIYGTPANVDSLRHNRHSWPQMDHSDTAILAQWTKTSSDGRDHRFTNKNCHFKQWTAWPLTPFRPIVDCAVQGLPNSFHSGLGKKQRMLRSNLRMNRDIQPEGFYSLDPDNRYRLNLSPRMYRRCSISRCRLPIIGAPSSSVTLPSRDPRSTGSI